MDDEIIEVMAKAQGFGSHGIVGERNARSALQALRNAGYTVVRTQQFETAMTYTEGGGGRLDAGGGGGG